MKPRRAISESLLARILGRWPHLASLAARLRAATTAARIRHFEKQIADDVLRCSIPDSVLAEIRIAAPDLATAVARLKNTVLSDSRVRDLESRIARIATTRPNIPLSTEDLLRLSFCVRGQPFGGHYDPCLLALSRSTGGKGGRLAAKRLSPRARRQRARQAARVRWAKEAGSVE